LKSGRQIARQPAASARAVKPPLTGAPPVRHALTRPSLAADRTFSSNQTTFNLKAELELKN